MPIPRALFLMLLMFSVACQTTQQAGGDAPGNPLTGPEWQLESIAGDAVIEGSRITLHFTDDGIVHGRTGCNLYNGVYQIREETLSIGELSQTRMACAPSIMRQEQTVLEALQATHRFRIDESGTLLLGGPGGQTLKAHRP